MSAALTRITRGNDIREQSGEGEQQCLANGEAADLRPDLAIHARKLDRKSHV